MTDKKALEAAARRLVEEWAETGGLRFLLDDDVQELRDNLTRRIVARWWRSRYEQP